MISRPLGVGAFQFVILASLRTAQLMRGCPPKVDGGHKPTVTALLEVALGKIAPLTAADLVVPSEDAVAAVAAGVL